MSPRTVATRLRVRFGETDRMGIVYHANYLTWFEVGRTELMRAAGYPYVRLEAEGLSLPVTSGDFRFVAPARYDDEITLVTRVVEVKSRRVTFAYEVRREDVLLATGTTVHSPVDRDGRVATFPRAVRDILAGDS